VQDMYAMLLLRKAKGWFTGYNSNVPGHEEGRIRYVVYNGGQPKYVGILNQVAMSGYEGVTFGEPSSPEVSGARHSSGAQAA